MQFIDDINIGAHIHKDNTLYNSVYNVLKYPMCCAQIYLGSSRGYAIPNIGKAECEKVRELCELYNFRVYVHSCLLYNLNGATNIDNIDELISKAKTPTKLNELKRKKITIPQNFQSTIDGLKAEMNICHSAFGTGVVVHIGSGEVKDKAKKRIASTVEKVLNESKGNIFLENAAGEGNKLGSTLAEMKEIYFNIAKSLRERVFFCIDTCHLYAAGEYDIEDEKETQRFFQDFESSIGNKIRLVHLNDSKGKFGCKKDRHETIAEGHIFKSEKGQESLKFLVKYCKKNNIDMVLETPAKLNILTNEVGHIHDINKILKIL